MCDSYYVKFLLRYLGISMLIVGGLSALWLYIVPPQTNTVWAVVESSVETGDFYNTTVLFTVEDEEYTGTYKGSFNSTNKYAVDEVIFLSATKDYSTVSDIDHVDTFNLWSSIIKAVSITCLVIGAVFITLAFIFAVNDTGWFSNTPESISYKELRSYIRDVKRIARKCRCKAYKESLFEVSESMEKQVKSLECLGSLLVSETVELYKVRRDTLKKTFIDIREMASQTAMEMHSDSSEEDLQRAVYQLQSYLELNK